jgi:hypothetical protein
MKSVALRLVCDSGWTDAAGEFIAKAVLVDLDLDTGLVRPHFENDPDVLNARGPMPVCGLLFEPAGVDDGSTLILGSAWDFVGKAAGFHIACRALAKHRAQLKQWAAWQETLPLVELRYHGAGGKAEKRLAA